MDLLCRSDLVVCASDPVTAASVSVTKDLYRGANRRSMAPLLAFSNNKGKPDESSGRKATGLKQNAKAAGLHWGQSDSPAQ
jgi:hypothetical protein